MAEKYDRNPEIPAHKDAAKKTYFVKKEKVNILFLIFFIFLLYSYNLIFLCNDNYQIKVVFHREKDRIIQSWREFKKPVSEQKENINELITEFQVFINFIYFLLAIYIK